jgi:hypothetical protein
MPLLTTRGGASVRGFGLFGKQPEPAPTVIGQIYGGGFYGGQISTTANGVPTHYLVIAPKDQGESQFQWKTSQTNSAGTGSVIDGPSNSSNMNNGLHPAAQFCEALSINGFGDWYMPSKNELEICYYNLKPSSQLNVTNSGINAHSVPTRSTNYTSGDPSQTSATIFQSGNAEAFELLNYWASTQSATATAWIQDFDNGTQASAAKTESLYVRAVRRVPV